jgi:hypothetical protein
MSYKLIKNDNNLEYMKYVWIFGSILVFFIIFKNIIKNKNIKCGNIELGNSNIEGFNQNSNNPYDILRRKKRV